MVCEGCRRTYDDGVKYVVTLYAETNHPEKVGLCPDGAGCRRVMLEQLRQYRRLGKQVSA